MNAPLVFIASTRQYESFKRSPEALADCVVATSDLDVWVDLKAEGREPINLLDYLDAREAAANKETSWRLCACVADALKGRFLFEGCDLAERIQNDLFHAFAYILNSLGVIQKVMSAEHPESVLYFKEMEKLICWDAPESPVDVFNAIVANCAERAGIPARGNLALGAETETTQPVYQTSKEVRRQLPQTLAVISIGPSIGLNESWALLESVASRGHPSWLLLDDGTAPFSVSSLRLTSLLNMPFDLDPIVHAVNGVGDTVRAALARDPAAALLVQNEHLGFMWDEYSRWLVTAARWYVLAQFLSDALRPDIVLTGYDIFGTLKCFTESLQKCGVHTVSIHHTSFDLSMLRRHQGVRGDVVTWGVYDSRDIGVWRETGRILEAGTFRRDLAPLRDTEIAARTEKSGNKPVSNPCVVLLTSRVTDLLDAAASSSQHYDDWVELVSYIARHPDWDFVIKPHPRYDYVLLYEEIINRAPGNVRMFKGSAAEILSVADVALEVNTPSSVAIEASAASVPVVYLKSALYCNLPNALEDGGVVLVETVTEMEKTVARLLTDDIYRAEVLKTQADFMRRAVVASGSEAVRRMFAYMEDVIGSSKQEAADPAARWLIDALMCVDYGMRGDYTRGEFLRRMGELRGRGKALDFDRLELFKLGELGPYILNWAVWQNWPPAVKLSIPLVLWSLHRAFPPSLRPVWRSFRVSLIHSFLVQADREPGRSVRRIKWFLLAMLLAPGRLLSLMKRRAG